VSTPEFSAADAASQELPSEENGAAEVEAAGNDKVVKLPLPERAKPWNTIQVRPGALSRNVREAEDVLAQATRNDPGRGIYQRGGLLVKLARLSKPSDADGIDRPADTLRIEWAGRGYLSQRLGEVARFERKNRDGDWIPTDPPTRVVGQLLDLGDWPSTPPLAGIVEAPTMRPDGSIITAPGYDAATGLYFDPGDTVFGPVPESPTREDAEEALVLLLDLLKDFPFVSPAARSVGLAEIMTPLIRPAVRTSPLFANDAPTPGTGKGLLGGVASWIMTGRQPATIGQWTDGAEEKRRLLAVMLEAPPVVMIDNIEQPLKSDTLCTILTEGQLRERVIGSSRTATGDARLTWIATGNNLELGGDLPRRTLICRMDPEMERPEDREFDRDLEAYVPAHRAELAAAILTIVRAYRVSGQRVAISPFGSFEGWSRFVREPLVWLGQADPIETRGTIRRRDPDLDTMHAILTEWHAAHGERALKVAEAAEDERVKAPMRDYAWNEKTGKTDLLKVSKLISRYEGRVFGGARIDKAGVHQGTVRWKVTVVE
jgi:putative DNA primase/helicase